MNRTSTLLRFAMLALMLPVIATAEQPPAAPKPLAHTYRLTYTVTVTDAGKRSGVEHFAMTISAPTNRALFKLGTKIPVATGVVYNGDGKAESPAQFTYLDVGINIDVSLSEEPNGLQLVSKIEQSSVDPTPVKIMDVNEPVIRQMVLTNTSVVSPGKSVVLGSLDVPDTTRHSTIEVLVEQMP